MEWWFEKNEAERAVQSLAGVKGVTNEIKIKPKASAPVIESDIERALERNALLDDSDIEVAVSGTKVTLRGTVSNYSEREEAVRIAWAAAGVTSVDDQLDIDWSDDSDD